MEKLRDIAAELGVELSQTQLAQFEKYYELLVEWNKVMNLTAITEREEVVVKHFADSLLLAKYRDLTKSLKVIDVGTGAGFPGVPLKIAFPNLQVTLLDSLNKRVKFLDQVIDALGLENICAIHARAEDAGRDAAHREQYDLAVSRAVANMSSLAEFCMPFVKTEGYFIPYKAAGVKEEMPAGKKAVRMLSGQVENIFTTTLPTTEVERTFVCVKKVAPLDEKYPRKAGLATKKPLGA